MCFAADKQLPVRKWPQKITTNFEIQFSAPSQPDLLPEPNPSWRIFITLENLFYKELGFGYAEWARRRFPVNSDDA